MEAILLINLDDILHYTSLSGNIDVDKINCHIFNSQILYLEPILGTDLYEKLLDLVDTNAITGTSYTQYKTLLDTYIIPSVVFHTVELYIPLNAFQIADGGTFQYQSTNAITTPLTDIDRISNKYKIIGSKYDDKLSAFLCKNSNNYPEYINNTGLVSKTENTNRGCSWYLGKNNITSKIRI